MSVMSNDDPPELTPWDRRPDNTPPLPPHQVPAWEVQPPPPDLPPLPPPVEPPDPLEYEPPRDNPNGVEGERGPRAPT